MLVVTQDSQKNHIVPNSDILGSLTIHQRERFLKVLFKYIYIYNKQYCAALGSFIELALLYAYLAALLQRDLILEGSCGPNLAGLDEAYFG